MAIFKFVGEVESIFHDLIAPDGTTVVAKPGEEVEVAKTNSVTAAAHPELEPVDGEAKAMAAAAEEKIRIEASRQFAPADAPAPEVVETAAGLVPDPPAAPAATAKVATPAAAPADASADDTPPAS